MHIYHTYRVETDAHISQIYVFGPLGYSALSRQQKASMEHRSDPIVSCLDSFPGMSTGLS